jgi:hypothetical protein
MIGIGAVNAQVDKPFVVFHMQAYTLSDPSKRFHGTPGPHYNPQVSTTHIHSPVLKSSRSNWELTETGLEFCKLAHEHFGAERMVQRGFETAALCQFDVKSLRFATEEGAAAHLDKIYKQKKDLYRDKDFEVSVFDDFEFQGLPEVVIRVPESWSE